MVFTPRSTSIVVDGSDRIRSGSRRHRIQLRAVSSSIGCSSGLPRSWTSTAMDEMTSSSVATTIRGHSCRTASSSRPSPDPPPVSWTPQQARKCARSEPWQSGREGRSIRSSRREAVRLCKVGDRSIEQVAKDLDLTETALRDWVKRADIDAGKGPPEALTTAEREELARLRRELKRVTMEREILKAAAHLLRQGERVKFAFIEVSQVAFPIGLMCEVLRVSRSG